VDSIGVASLKTLIKWLQVTQKPLLPKPYYPKKNKKATEMVASNYIEILQF